MNCGKPLKFCAPEILQNLTSTRPPAILKVKKAALAAGAAKLPCDKRNHAIIAPSSAPVCALGHLPPRGKALKGGGDPPCDQERSSFSKASKARLDSSAFLFRFPLTRYPRGGMSPKFTFIG